LDRVRCQQSKKPLTERLFCARLRFAGGAATEAGTSRLETAGGHAASGQPPCRTVAARGSGALSPQDALPTNGTTMARASSLRGRAKRNFP